MSFSSLKNWVERLIIVSKGDNVVVLVEGKNDVKKLSSYGVENLYPIRGRKFYDIVEDLEFCNHCIILVDLDKQGEKIFKKIKFMLEREGIPVDTSFRDYLKTQPYEEIENLPNIEDIR